MAYFWTRFEPDLDGLFMDQVRVRPDRTKGIPEFDQKLNEFCYEIRSSIQIT